MMFDYAGNVRELEALKVSNEGIIKEQQASLTTLRARLKHLEDENEDLMNSQKSDTQKSSARIKSLENVSSPILFFFPSITFCLAI